MSAPDYSDLFGSTELSDIAIVLAEHAEDVPLLAAVDSLSLHGDSSSSSSSSLSSSTAAVAEKEGVRVIPGHRIVLYGSSSFCKAKLLTWKGEGDNGMKELCIPVPTGQLEVGELLVRCMYAAQPDFSSCSQEQLLNLLLLADSYGVPKVLAAAAAAFASVAPADLQWQALHALYALPSGCAELDACKPLFAAAGQKLQHELGDLELQDAHTRVASENTVFYTIDRWCRQQQKQQQQQTLKTTATHELLKLVQMQASD
uniref:BTB domain-containing protein n=1 Tax=Tetradesmus obliquus TaxID=3088 RepID=A0A383WDK7_TETOB|eukprot:jgi/Sobl393_1/3811/SZX75252.1